MKEDDQKQTPLRTIRERAEQLVRLTGAEISEMPPDNVEEMVHELQVHQIELELQNEELREAQLSLAKSHDRYLDLFDFAPVGYLISDQHGQIFEANLTAASMLQLPRRDLIKKNLLRFASNSGASDSMHRFFQSVFSGEAGVASRSQCCEVELLRGDGSSFFARLDSIAFDKKEGSAACCRTALIDITEEREAKRWEEEANRFREIVENLPAGAIFVQSRDRIFLNRNAEEITGFSRSELSSVSDWFRLLYPENPGQTRQVYEKSRAAGFPDHVISRIRGKDGCKRDIEFAAHEFDEHEVWLLNDITDRLRLEGEVVTAVEGDRRRIAQELHDGVGSLLTGISLYLGALRKKIEAKKTIEPSEIEAVASLIGDAITQSRNIAKGIHPIGSAPEEFMSALRKLTAQVDAAHPPACLFRCESPVMVEDPVVANQLYRITQEAVNNAVKHSGAKSIAVNLAQKADHISVEIVDDGAGFDTSNQRSEGLGLHIMRYRNRAISGDLTIEKNPGGGTKVACSVPVREASPCAL